MDKLVAMETFVRVVQAGSFTAAARSWGRSKARLSQTVSALEDELGVTLLQRTTRSLKLTDSGRRYLRRCADLLGAIEALESEIKDERQAVVGVLRVSAPPGLAERYLDALVTDFRAVHPGVCIHLDLTHRMVDLVEEGVDVAIRVTEPRDSALIVRKLAPAPIVAVASPDYLERRGRPRDPTRLRDHDCLVDTNFRDQHRWRFRSKRGPITVSVSGPVRVNSPAAVRELAVAGHGVGLIPRLTIEEELDRGVLVELFPGRVAIEWSVCAVYPRRDHLPVRVRAYIDHLARAFA